MFFLNPIIKVNRCSQTCSLTQHYGERAACASFFINYYYHKVVDYTSIHCREQPLFCIFVSELQKMLKKIYSLHIHGKQKMNPNDFSNFFSTMRFTFVVLREMYQQLLDGLPLKLVQTIVLSSGWMRIVTTLTCCSLQFTFRFIIRLQRLTKYFKLLSCCKTNDWC